MAPIAFYGEIIQLRTNRNLDLQKKAKKRSSSAPHPPAKGQHIINSMFRPFATSTSNSNSSSDSNSSSSSTLPPKPQPQPQDQPAPKPKPKPQPKQQPKPQPQPQEKPGPKPNPKPQPKPQPKPAAEREYIEEECRQQQEKTEKEILEYLLAVNGKMAHPLHPKYGNDEEGVGWWLKRCKSTSLRIQTARMGADAYMMEEFWMKYGHPEFLDRESMYPFFFCMKHTPASDCGAYNHCPRFLFFMTHFIDSMPIGSIGEIFLADPWNPKYASHIYKVTVTVDKLGDIVWICPLAPGTSTDVLIWDGYGPSHTRG